MALFEHRTSPLLPFARFCRRQLAFAAYAAVIILTSLGIGTVGYHVFEELNWLDSMYSAAMILTGMGPAMELKHDSAKVFVTLYAIFSAVVFLSASALLFTPLFHRLMHALHLDQEQDEEGERGRCVTTHSAQHLR